MLANYEIQRGDVLWLKMPQSLAPLDVARNQPDKIRPFIALSEKLNVRIDQGTGECLQDRSLFGVDCTSQPHLVDGRPHIQFYMPRETKPTYALLDSVRDISLGGQKLKRGHQISEEEEEQILEGLGAILKPEQKFYLTGLFNRKTQCMPGQIWRVKSINADGEALVLLRRGRFITNDEVTRSQDLNTSLHQARFTPYLVAYFKKATGVTNLRGMKWDDLQIMALQDHSFIEKTAELSAQTVGILLNTVRGRVGLPAIEYNQLGFSHNFGLGALLRALAMPLGVRAP